MVALPRFYEASGLAAIVHDALRKRSREVEWLQDLSSCFCFSSG